MINRYIIFLFLALVSFSCGDDNDTEEMEEMEETETECESTVSASVDGTTISFGTPFSATLVNVYQGASTELLIFWSDNNRTMNLQAIFDEPDIACFPEGRIEIKDLPSGFSLLGFQYTEGFTTIASVDNIFIEAAGDGWLDVTSCDGDNDEISVEFGFNATTTNGDIINVTSGKSENICFERTK